MNLLEYLDLTGYGRPGNAGNIGVPLPHAIPIVLQKWCPIGDLPRVFYTAEALRLVDEGVRGGCLVRSQEGRVFYSARLFELSAAIQDGFTRTERMLGSVIFIIIIETLLMTQILVSCIRMIIKILPAIR